jgi:low affinity Fe/Cu permease
MESFRKAAIAVANGVGSYWAFFAALLVVAGWAVTGPLFGFSNTWQLFINSFTTIVTFLMVFIIQASQNREERAVQLKLDELIRATRGARTRFADLEEADESELKAFAEEFRALRKKGVPREDAISQAVDRHGQKRERR